MAKDTLLTIVQDILNDIGGDEVNSIDDTVESEQIATIAKGLYLELMNEREWPHLKKWIQITPTDSSTPSHMKLPDNVQDTLEVKYDTSSSGNSVNYETITYKTPSEFMAITDSRDSTNANVLEITDFDGVKLYIQDNKQPEYWTSFDDEYIVFDSYDADEDSNLQQSKSKVYVYEEPAFSVTNTHVPDMPSKEFPLFKAKLRTLAFNDVAVQPNPKAERRERLLDNRAAQQKFRTHGGIKYNFNNGRK